MFARVTNLRYWKSEHDEQTCEDDGRGDIAHGLFAVADGAGATLFSNIWASVLVEHYLTVPLLSGNPFEVEWWVRQAQDQHQAQMPTLEGLAWNAAQKMQNQGSHSTLATLCFTDVGAVSAQAQMLVFGDSCVIIGKTASKQVVPFPLKLPADFEQAPICLPSKRSIFNRYFHQPGITSVALKPDDIVILATDAVSKWIISAGGGRYTAQWQAFQEVVTQTADTWPAFIQECRARNEMGDDDTTALIIALQLDSSANGEKLGATIEHSQRTREQRHKDFEEALAARNKELVAITFGDGVDLRREGIDIAQGQLQEARQVADALRNLLEVLRRELNTPQMLSKVEPVWRRYSDILRDEPCAASLRRTLTQLGIAVTPAARATEVPATISQASGTPADSQKLQQREKDSHYQLMRDALDSKSAAQMAEVYEAVIKDTAMPPADELAQLKLAHMFRGIYETDRDQVILAAYEEILQSSYPGAILFTPEEEERIALAWQRQMILGMLPSLMPFKHASTISVPWFNKVCSVKQAYLSWKFRVDLDTLQLQQLALADITYDHMIQQSIQNVNEHISPRQLDPEGLLPQVFADFWNAQGATYAALLLNNELTDEEVQVILLIFLRHELFEQYIYRQYGMPLSDWLDRHRSENDLIIESTASPTEQSAQEKHAGGSGQQKRQRPEREKRS
jgi:serine/threonine protein phosphatase PrpC